MLLKDKYINNNVIINHKNCLHFVNIIIIYICAMKVIELGQNWKIAALRSSFHVHIFFGGKMEIIYMDLAFKYARKAFNKNEVPIGAVIVKDGKVISCAYNNKASKNTVFGHAELIAIKKAEKKMNNWRLDGCDIYVTLDPCPMCASAIKQSRINNVFSALRNSDSHNSVIINKIFLSDNVNPSVNFYTDLKVFESKLLLSSFFEKKRK